MANVKITVLKKHKNDEIINEYALDTTVPECSKIGPIGKEYVTTGINIPEDFCSWAWVDIHRDVIHLVFGGDFPFMKQKGTAIAACTDGLKPVIFKIERLDS